MTETDVRRSKRLGMWFGIIFGIKGALIGVASTICNATDHFDLFFPVMGLIVGTHFFPLAHLFRVKIHYITGTLLSMLAAVSLLMVPTRVTLGDHQIVAPWVSVGFSTRSLNISDWSIERPPTDSLLYFSEYDAKDPASGQAVLNEFTEGAITVA
ncbi:MAG: hypothetical protein K6T83_03875 [Alicyclobacillus sp.]|nr:hypothetical protein [Alicyclobacillus sp.]